MKEVIEKILDDFAKEYSQVNFDSQALRQMLAEYVVEKLNELPDLNDL